jgi:membrane protein CcdC involved in cytochrome C biogenesis
MSDEIIEEKYVFIKIGENPTEENNSLASPVFLSTGEANFVNEFLKESNSDFVYEILKEDNS